MSSAIVRRNSSKIGLQNLLRLTAQRSIEDEEEIARERRRRAREGLGSQSSFSSTSLTSPDNASPEEDGLLDCEFKPSYPVAVEEDEGFSDWTQKLERRRQKRLEEQVQGEEDSLSEAKLVPAQSQRKLDEQKELEEEWERKEKDRRDLSQRKLDEQKELEEEWERKEKDRRDLSQRKLDEQKELEEEWERKEKDRRELHEKLQREETEQRQQEKEKGRLMKEEDRRNAALKKKEEEHRREMEEKVKEKDGEVKVSYTSRAFLQQEVIHINSNGNATEKKVTLHLTSPKRILRTTSQSQVDDDEQDVFTETEQKLEKIRRSHEEKESQEYEWLRQKQAEAEVELEELNKRREERRRLREEEERRQEQEELERKAKEEARLLQEEKRRMKEEIERRRMQAAEKRQKTLSTSSCEGDEPFSPLSPKSPTFKNENAERVTAGNTHSIIERTDSLNRSLKKSNSFKKIQPQVPISKIDNRLEQYTHAIEISTKESRAAKQSLMDIPPTAELVASKKSLWEGGEALSPSSSKGTPCKDTEGLKIGVSDLITQWVKGTPDKNTPSKPSDVMAGDVLNKKNIWENKIDSTPSANKGAALKSTPSGKRYKFIVSGHGKYEKVPISDDNHAEYTNENILKRTASHILVALESLFLSKSWLSLSFSPDGAYHEES
ncbi:non-muscle caldesmon-like isoform X2 [Acipenser ruthenus]|uniref:non-muscle caldesmon-like isoform X2 n=1 Tax=Acipenser ruthenus TaxID=7906 RepID=UPI002740C7F1|nr:non-muscle caldesmon-like isoform X2 [Acipenser ruthenus]